MSTLSHRAALRALAILAVSAVLALLAAPSPCLADPRYTVTVLGGAGSAAADINSSGQVVGSSPVGGVDHAVLYSGGATIDLGTFGGASSRASGLNDLGQVVGAYQTNATDLHAFVYASGAMSDLGTLGGTSSEAARINNAGVVVGRSTTTAGGNNFAFRYSGGVMQNLGSLSGGEISDAAAINNSGQITGTSYVGPYSFPEYPYHAYVYAGGAMTDINTDPLSFSQGTAINDSGQVAGDFSLPTDFHVHHAFIYSGGTMTDLGVLPGDDPLFGETVSSDINNLGQVVGHSSRYGLGRAFLYEGGGLLTLDALVDPALGWSMVGASAINDAQQIATTACKAGVCFAVRLDLIPSIPEPAPGGLLLAGLGLLGLIGRRHARSAAPPRSVSSTAPAAPTPA